MVRCRVAIASSIVTKVWGEVVTHFHAVTVECHSNMQKWLFCLWLCSSPVLPFSVLVTHVRLLLSSLNACLIIARVSATIFLKFPQNLMHPCCSCVMKSHQAR
jgi:hypothetical protein